MRKIFYKHDQYQYKYFVQFAQLFNIYEMYLRSKSSPDLSRSAINIQVSK